MASPEIPIREGKKYGPTGTLMQYGINSWRINVVVFRHLSNISLREKCPDTEFFLVRIFLHSDRIRRDNSYFSVFSPNAGKYGPEKTPYLDTFHVVSKVEK